MHSFWHYPSTYVALVVWGVTGFMAQPNLASLFVHLIVAPIALLVALWLAHYEGRKEGDSNAHNS